MNPIEDFLNFLQKNEIAPANPADIVADDTRRYYTVEGDKQGVKKASYALAANGDFAYGYATSMRSGITYSYTSKSDKKFNSEELAAWKIKSAEARKKQEAELLKWQTEVQKIAISLLASSQLAVNHPYLEHKQVKPYTGVKCGYWEQRKKQNCIFIPLRDEKRLVWNIQAVFPEIDKELERDKDFLYGGRKQGLYFSIGTTTDILVICEGYSTGASIHEATGHTVVIAFDAGNLKPVALAIKAKFPDARLIFCADNDQFKQENTGIIKANQAAGAIGGAVVIFPEFADADLEGKPTDWNDAAILYGKEWVAEKILSAIKPPTAEITPDDCPIMEYAPIDTEYMEYGDMPEDEPPPQKQIENSKTDGDIDNLPFRVLGYNSGIYYYYSFGEKRIIALTPSGHNLLNFFQLASQFQILEPHRDVGGKLLYSEKQIAQTLASKMMALAQQRGIFSEEDKVRGIGAWIDDGRVFLHCGSEIYVNSRKTHFDDIRSEFTYIAAARLVTPSKDALTNADARRLREICEMVTWEKKLSGTLLSGWLVIAPICAALQFRPHIFITGEAESGKSTILNRIIKPVLGKIALCMDGGTTEPAIRTSMGYDARPLIYDEAEPSQSMAGVIELLRKSSTGSVVKKFGQQPFKARFCACLSGINPPINKTADESRIAFMKIKKNIKSTAIEDFANLLDKIEETITDDFAEKMLARTLQNMNSLLENIKIFQKAFRSCNPQSARASELIGTMLAGVYMLGRTDIISTEDALKFIKAHDWSSHTNIQEDSDPIRLLQHIISSLVKTTGGQDISIGELITRVSSGDESANKLLRNHGIRVEREYVSIATRSQNLAKLLKETDWGMRWGSTLADIKDATVVNIEYFSPLVKARAVRLPISLFIENETLDEVIEF
jgi:putative DNA primase/helicase